jgi:SNF2 family DNA or RNA helicase
MGAIDKIDCEKVSTNENLVELVTRDIAKNLHNAELELNMKLSVVFSSKKAKEESIARSEEKVMELRSKIDNIKQKVLEEDLCPVCYDEITNTTLVPCCNTKYCLECITMCSNTGNTACPFCRTKFSMNDLVILMDDECHSNKGGSKKPIMKDKIFALRKVIENAKTREDPNFKLLIFADYDASFDNLLSVLNDARLKHFTIKGTSSTICKNIANYKSTDPENPDKIDVLLLNSNHCGSGINLENTTDLVMYHDMTDSKITQIIGRAQRPGRTSQLNIWRLLHDFEIPQSSGSNRGNLGEAIIFQE